MLNRNLESSDDGVETFYPSSPPPSNNASAGSTPISSTSPLDGCVSPATCASARSSSSGGIFSHLKSSKSKNTSKEDLATNSGVPFHTAERGKDVGGIQRIQNTDNAISSAAQDRKSPVATTKQPR